MFFNKKIFFLLIIGLFFRLFIVFCLPVRSFDNTIKRYHNAAVNLIEGRGYSLFSSPPYRPSILKPPAYPLFLAGIYGLFGVHPNIVKIFQVFVDTLGCFILFLLARKYFNQKAALCVMFLSCVCPISAVYTNLLNPESLTLFFMILSLWLIANAAIYNKAVFFFTAGLSVILMGYCRPEFSIFVFIFGTVIFFMTKKSRMKCFMFYVLGVILIMSPWVLRNYYLTRRFIPLTVGDAAGTALYLGALGKEGDSQEDFSKFLDDNPKIKQLYLDRYKFGPHNQELTFSGASKYEDIFLKLAIEKIIGNPKEYIFTRIRAIPRIWINLHADEYTFFNTQKLRVLHPDFKVIIRYIKEDPKEVIILIMKYIFLTVNIFYLLMAVRGLWSVRSGLVKLCFIVIPVLYAQVFFLFMYRSAVYTIPYWPCVTFFSGIGFYFTFFDRDAKKEGVWNRPVA